MKSDIEKKYSTDQSSLVNDACNTLKDPFKRANYMLDLHDIDIGKNDKRSGYGEAYNIMDVEYLTEQFEVQEEISTATTQRLNELKQQYDDEYKNYINYLTKAFQDQNINMVIEYIKRISFINTIKENISERL